LNGAMMSEKSWIETLILMAKEGALKGEAKISSSWLAKQLGGSRQTAIRRLAEFESKGLINRRVAPRGQAVRISSAGISALRAVHRELETILELSSKSLTLSGTVVTGMGEGSYYMGQPNYAKQFEKELGFAPYPGTLDIKLDKGSFELKETLTRLPSKQVSGFRTDERTFGPVKFFEARLKGKRTAIVIPLRTHHTDILEIIAPYNLRKKLGLKDGDPVKLEVPL
jgi:riboflavin kinase